MKRTTKRKIKKAWKTWKQSTIDFLSGFTVLTIIFTLIVLMFIILFF